MFYLLFCHTPQPDRSAAAAAAMSAGPGARLARLLLVACCVLLSGYQCWTLLQLFLGEPVSATTSFTPWEDVDVPAVTLCDTPYPWQKYNHYFGRKLSVSQQIWKGSASIEKLLHSCEPQCIPAEVIDYPAGEVEVGIGSWTSWVSLTEGALCHTLIPNVTWGQLAQAAGHKMFNLELKVYDLSNIMKCDYRLFVHPRRRPVVSNPGVREVQQDLRQRHACYEQNRASYQMTAKIISRVHDRESLNRARCQPGSDYHYETCIIDCSYRQWADKHNCSTPDMLQQYPHLSECSRKDMRLLASIGGLTANASGCSCLPACRRRSFVADTGAMSLPPAGPRASRVENILVVRVSAASLAEEVTTERRSYPLASLLSEMGGFVSLLLGVSVLSVADMLTELLTKTDRGGRPAPADAEDRPLTAGPTDAGGTLNSDRTPDNPATAEVQSEHSGIFTIQG